jgi:hypothetical protein
MAKGTHTARTGKAGGGGDARASSIERAIISSELGKATGRTKSGPKSKNAGATEVQLTNGMNVRITSSMAREAEIALGKGQDYTLIVTRGAGKAGRRNPGKETSVTLKAKDAKSRQIIREILRETAASSAAMGRKMASQGPRASYRQVVTSGRGN